jgi:hypothetical protein
MIAKFASSIGKPATVRPTNWSPAEIKSKISVLNSLKQRVNISATINTDAPGVKTFLLQFFTNAKICAKIFHAANGRTYIIFQGNQNQQKHLLKALEFLRDLLCNHYGGGTAIVSESFESAIKDEYFDGATIENTVPGLKRADSSGSLKQEHFEEIPKKSRH